MILPQSNGIVLALMVLSLLFLGAWTSLYKATGKWRFELFYFDFTLGLLVALLLCSFTFGDLGYDGFSFMDDIQHAGKRQFVYALLSGIIFNLGNMLTMAGISVAGISTAIPMSIGVGMILTNLLSLAGRPTGNSTFIFLGCVIILTAVVVAAIGYRITGVLRHEQLARAGHAKSTRRPSPIKAIFLSVAGGLLIGSFGGLIHKATDDPTLGLGPYSATALFGFGILLSSFVFNIFFMNLPVEGEPLEFSAYFNSRANQHILAALAGMLFYVGTLAAAVSLFVPANLQPNAVTSYLLTRGWPIVAMFLGMAFWKEAKGGDMRVKILAALMLVLFACGMAMIGLAPMYLQKV